MKGFSPVGVKGVLESCGQAKAHLWQRSKTFFMYGVLFFRANISTKTAGTVIDSISKVYPMHDGGRRMCAIALARDQNIRGSYLIGDIEDVVRFWADLWSGVIAMPHFNVVADSICWTGLPGGGYFIPYLDFDEVGPHDGLTAIFTERVEPCVLLIFKALMEKNPEVDLQMYYCRRPSDKFPGMFKYSFHVHFHNCLVWDILGFKDFIKAIPGIPLARAWSRNADGDYVVTEEQGSVMFDTAVYGGQNQIFRGPFCGKGGLASALLVAGEVDRGDDGICFFVPDTTSSVAELIYKARISCPKQTNVEHVPLTIVDFGSSASVNAPVRSASSLASPPAAAGFDPSPLHTFMAPAITAYVLPAWQRYRHELLLKAGQCGATVSHSNIEVVSCKSDPNNRNILFYKIRGDSFCMTDGNHFHSRSDNVISVVIDLFKCCVWQGCFACGTRSEKFYFLHGPDNTIAIRTKAESEMTRDNCFRPSPNYHQVLLTFYTENFVHDHELDIIWAFNRETKTWTKEAAASGIVVGMITELNANYVEYIRDRQIQIAELEVARYRITAPDASAEDVRAMTNKLNKDGRVFILKNNAIIKVNAQGRAKVIEELRHANVPQVVDCMNPNPRLIPMKNGKTYDVFTGEESPIRRDSYFTSLLDAEITCDHDDLNVIRDWFAEIATGDMQKNNYNKIIAAYLMTFFTHDRKFIVIRGVGKNGKGMFKQFILSILGGTQSTGPRWKAFNQLFWEKKSNSNGNAESASPEAWGMANATAFYTDDMERVMLDAGKIKRVVAGEAFSGRPLFGKPCTIMPRGTIFWTTNFLMDLPGGDNAAWERFECIDFNTKYVENPALVNPAEFRFLQNNVRYTELLTKKDAFFTIAMHTLTAYYKSLPKDPMTGSPALLASFPIPPSMKLAKRAARAQQLPLANFINTHTIPSDQPLSFPTVDTMFEMYMIFLDNGNERRIRGATTLMSFVRELLTSLEIKCTAVHVTGLTIVTTPANRKRGRNGNQIIVLIMKSDPV